MRGSAPLSSSSPPSVVVLEAMRGLAGPSGELIQPGLLTCVFRYETDEPKCTADAGLARLNAFRGHRPARLCVSLCVCVLFFSPHLMLLLHGSSDRLVRHDITLMP